MAKSFLPLLQRMGPTVEAVLERPGFYPAGGGRFRVSIQPVEKLKPIELMDRGQIKAKRGRILLAHLPDEIGSRQARMLRNKLNWPEDAIELSRFKNSAGPGNAVMAEVESEHVTEVFTGFGERDIPSGKVVGGVVDQVREYLTSDAPVGEYLADQLMIPLAMAGGGSYRAVKASLHARTNPDVIERFVDSAIKITQTDKTGAVFECGS